MNKYVKARHRFFFTMLRPIARIVARKFYFKAKAVKLPKKTNYLILSNHQSFFDPVWVGLSFRRPIYFVAGDAFLSQKWYLRLLM